jgi:chemotaxis protein methyltransferase CheR
VTELVLDALKRDIPSVAQPGQVVVAYEIAGTGWKLSISDNGVPQTDTGPLGQESSSLGTSIVKALAQQLGAEVEVLSGPAGTTVSIAHATLATTHASRKDLLARARASEAPHTPSTGPGAGRSKFAA